MCVLSIKALIHKSLETYLMSLVIWAQLYDFKYSCLIPMILWHICPWPSCQNKKCTCVNSRCIRSKISGDGLGCRWVEWSANVTLARSRWISNYYITPVTGSSDQLERRYWNENHVPAEAGPPGPRLSSPGERERNVVMARRVGGGQYDAVLFSLQLTSNT